MIEIKKKREKNFNLYLTKQKKTADRKNKKTTRGEWNVFENAIVRELFSVFGMKSA